MYERVVMKRKSIIYIYLLSALINMSHSYLYGYDIKQVLGKKNIQHIIPVVVIGSGPAGLSAGMYTARAHIPTLIIAGDLPGGQLMLTSDVENWPGVSRVKGSSIINILKKQATDAGASVMLDTVSSIETDSWPYKITLQSGSIIHALSVIIATGATPARLGVKGEDHYWGSGVSTCAICDCAFFHDKDVAIIGGGDSAIEEALQLAPYVRSAEIFVRKSFMKASPAMQKKLADYPHISVTYNHEAREIIGDGSHVTGISMYDTKKDIEYIYKKDGIFLAIGHIPNTSFCTSHIACDDHGYVLIDKHTKETNKKGIFAAGDVEDSEYRQAVVAGSSGCQAHFGAVSFLRSAGWVDSYRKLCSPLLETVHYKDSFM
jgi:thioredoxin reductase (NADPH)